MDGVHDMGAMHGFGRVVTREGDRSHLEPWEVRAQVLGLLSGAVDRAELEALEPATYLGASYYVRWLLAAETALLAQGRIDPADLERWRETFTADPDATAPSSSDPDLVEVIRNLGPHAHEPATAASFAVGDRVRVRRMRPEQHHRCPRYLRGAIGEIEKVLGCDPVPGVRPNASEPCYTVRFSSVDLFGDQSESGELPYVLLIDLWQRYLEDPR